VSDHSNQTPKQHITCKTCGRSDMPDWDGNGHCITCARAAVLADTPEQRLEATLDELMQETSKRIVNGIAISIAIKKNYDTEQLEKWLKAAVLAAVSAELRALVPEKRMVRDDGDLEDEYTGKRLKHELQENNINVGFNDAIDTMITNAKARGFDL
jgi:hypothetical protein